MLLASAAREQIPELFGPISVLAPELRRYEAGCKRVDNGQPISRPNPASCAQAVDKT